jgi:hypothetical protein
MASTRVARLCLGLLVAVAGDKAQSGMGSLRGSGGTAAASESAQALGELGGAAAATEQAAGISREPRVEEQLEDEQAEQQQLEQLQQSSQQQPCADHAWDCIAWAKQGKCQTDSAYMLKTCYKVCSGCTPPPSNCEDHDWNCIEWAAAGKCQSNSAYMTQTCRKACRLCEP